jgi:hypothetical protein
VHRPNRHACGRKTKGNCKLDDCSAGKIEQDREKSISRNYHWLQKILCRKILCALETMSADGNQNPKHKIFTSSKAQGAEQEHKEKKQNSRIETGN